MTTINKYLALILLRYTFYNIWEYLCCLRDNDLNVMYFIKIENSQFVHMFMEIQVFNSHVSRDTYVKSLVSDNITKNKIYRFSYIFSVGTLKKSIKKGTTNHIMTRRAFEIYIIVIARNRFELLIYG